jgi:hypothetical protein
MDKQFKIMDFLTIYKRAFSTVFNPLNFNYLLFSIIASLSVSGSNYQWIIKASVLKTYLTFYRYTHAVHKTN